MGGGTDGEPGLPKLRWLGEPMRFNLDNGPALSGYDELEGVRRKKGIQVGGRGTEGPCLERGQAQRDQVVSPMRPPSRPPRDHCLRDFWLEKAEAPCTHSRPAILLPSFSPHHPNPREGDIGDTSETLTQNQAKMWGEGLSRQFLQSYSRKGWRGDLLWPQ